ncbi:hypothetical protein [Primorskyibacter sp. S87]|uniref:hypothetical protein n=1 Tax=Primorskyibacter sp. S87 TaxID=3415126 RepID=UPI003C7A489D
MFLELIGTVFAGLAAAGLIMVVNLLTGRRLPRWFTPVGAGLAMIFATISSEYSWYDRTREKLPEGMVIVQEVESRALYRPWTYVVPFVERFVAVDVATVRQNPSQPGHRLGDVYFFGRWAPLSKLPVLADCSELRRANLADGAEFDADGTILNPDWITVSADDPIVKAMCTEG